MPRGFFDEYKMNLSQSEETVEESIEESEEKQGIQPFSYANADEIVKAWGRGPPEPVEEEPKQELFLRNVQEVQADLRQQDIPILEDPKSIDPIEYTGGYLIPESARTGGVMIFAPTRWGKSRVQGRGVCFADLQQQVGTVVIDGIGATIDNLLDKVLYLEKDEQLAALDRIKYCNMGGEKINSDIYVTSWAMLHRRTEDELLHKTSQRFIKLIEKTEAAFAQAPIMGLTRFKTILTNISLVLGAFGLPLSQAYDMLDKHEDWTEHFKRLENHPEVGFAATDLQEFFKQDKKVRDQLVEPLKNRLSFLRHDLISREMFAGGHKPSIDWEEVVQQGQTVLLDFRQDDDEKLLKFFWCWESLLEYVRNRESAGREYPPLSIVIDELAFFVHETTVNKEKISKDFHDLIFVRKGNANLWLTFATQNQEQLPADMRLACLGMASKIFGAVHDLESAYELARLYYEVDPEKTKQVERIGEWEDVVVGHRRYMGHSFEVKRRSFQPYPDDPGDVHTVFQSYNEQYHEHSRKFINQEKGHGLFVQSQYEGHDPKELLPISVNNLDPGQYVNHAMVTELRRRLMQRDGIRITQAIPMEAPQSSQQQLPHLSAPDQEEVVTPPKAKRAGKGSKTRYKVQRTRTDQP